MNKLSITLFRALCREVNALKALYPAVDCVTLRKPIDEEIGSAQPNRHHRTNTAEDLLEAVEQVVPGLEVPPHRSPLTWHELKQLIRDNFRANAAVRQSQVPPLIDQAFAALRALPEQVYLQACSCTTSAQGVVVEVTSSYSHQQPNEVGNPVSLFKYRVRISNTREHPVRVLGRGWHIQNDDGRLEAVVPLAADNGVVGNKPVIAPGRCFQYCSAAMLSPTGSHDAQVLPSGSMEGALVVDMYDDDGRESVQRVQVPVGPFKLMAPARKSGAKSSRKQ